MQSGCGRKGCMLHKEVRGGPASPSAASHPYAHLQQQPQALVVLQEEKVPVAEHARVGHERCEHRAGIQQRYARQRKAGAHHQAVRDDDAAEHGQREDGRQQQQRAQTVEHAPLLRVRGEAWPARHKKCGCAQSARTI
eukprot:169468-Chlamydomonas_euryale.AAC.1